MTLLQRTSAVTGGGRDHAFCSARVTMLITAILLTAATAGADVRVEFHEGRVTVVARNASIQQILTEWARVGGTEVLHAEQMNPAPIAVELNEISENEAPDILLRSAAGYVAAPRRSAVLNRSRYERVLIVAVSTPTSPSAISPPAPTVAAPPRTVIRGPRFGSGSPAEERGDDKPGVSSTRVGPFGSPGSSVPGVVVPAPRPRTLPPGPFPGGEPVYSDAPARPLDSATTGDPK